MKPTVCIAFVWTLAASEPNVTKIEIFNKLSKWVTGLQSSISDASMYPNISKWSHIFMDTHCLGTTSYCFNGRPTGPTAIVDVFQWLCFWQRRCARACMCVCVCFCGRNGWKIVPDARTRKHVTNITFVHRWPGWLESAIHMNTIRSVKMSYSYWKWCYVWHGSHWERVQSVWAKRCLCNLLVDGQMWFHRNCVHVLAMARQIDEHPRHPEQCEKLKTIDFWFKVTNCS